MGNKMNRMTLEQANEHFKLKFAAQLANESLAEAKAEYHDAEYSAMAANARLVNFEDALINEGIDPDAS
jgi:hypothetical protein